MPDIRVDIAPDAAPDGDPGLWQWRDISAYRRQSADVEIEYGRADESSQVEPGSGSCTFDMRDGLLVPRNPLSELYGRIGVNTPIRYRLKIGSDNFDRTVAAGWGTSSGGKTWTAPNAMTVSGGAGRIPLTTANTATQAILNDTAAHDIDVVHSVALSAVTTGAAWISSILLRRVDNDNQYRAQVELRPAGVITVRLVRVFNGVEAGMVENLSVAGTYTPGSKVYFRAQAFGPYLRAKAWTGSLGAQPTAWQVQASDSRVEGTAFGIYEWRTSGVTNVGTLTAAIDDLTIDAVLWEGNVPQWSPEWDKSGEDATTSIEASGPLRRLTAGNPPIKSPLMQQLGAYNPAGWWPCEDESGAQSLFNAVPGGRPATIRDVTLAADYDALAGSSTVAKLNNNAALVVGRCKNVTYTEWAAMVFYRYPVMPSGEIRLIEWESAGTARWWQVVAAPTGFRVLVYDTNNAVLFSSGTFTYAINPLNTFSVQLETKQNGGNIDFTLIWNEVGKSTFFFVADSFAGTCGRPLGFKINGTTYPDALFGHIWMGPETLPYVNTTFLAVSSGYVGELARDRVIRLFLEQNLPVAAYLGDSEPLARQQPGYFLDLVRDAVKADIGLMFERGSTVGIVPRGGRYNRPVSMALDWGGGGLAAAPRPTDDDQRLRNQWTISRPEGSEATDQNDASIARHGLIADTDEVNIQLDERLRQYVGWYLNLTTYDDFRWPTIEIDLIAHPELVAPFMACRVGSRITVANPKAQVPGITIDLLIEGIKQSIGRHRWRVTLTCSPALPWDVAVYNSLSKRKDSRASFLNAGYNASVTMMVVKFANIRDQWSTTNTYLWDLKGETVRVTAMGAVTGSGPYTQTATVVRGVNGVAKAHLVDEPVHVHPTQLARYAL